MGNKSLKGDQNKESTAKNTILELVSVLLKLAGAALMIIALLCAWADNLGLGITLLWIGVALQIVAELVDPKSNSKALSESDPAQETVSGSAPVPTPAPAPVAVPAQPEQVRISCGYCGQPMLIPPQCGTVKITCPKCGGSFIYNSNNS
ncbi:MAG: hypothetical protein J6A16_07585 [Oscillospiraceae bacterium]|nr:hypothetical protein [Oscillospiraceae bacterium]